MVADLKFRNYLTLLNIIIVLLADKKKHGSFSILTKGTGNAYHLH